MNKKIIFVCQKVTYDGASKMLNWTVNKLAEIPGNNVSLYTFITQRQIIVSMKM